MMKRLGALIVGCLMACAAIAASTVQNDLRIERRVFGSGLQNATGYEIANPVGNFGVYHAPQYLPGFPTAATIWPRVIDVKCSGDKCEGYNWLPEYGRGEYLFFRPVQVVAPVPERVLVPGPERVIIRKIRE